MTRAHTKTKTAFRCSACGHEEAKWAGRCAGCGQWNTLSDTTIAPTKVRKTKAAVARGPEVQAIVEVVVGHLGADHKRAAETVDQILAGGMTSVALAELVRDVIETCRAKEGTASPIENPMGYLVRLARQQIGEGSRSPKVNAGDWERYAGEATALTPMATTMKQLAEKLAATPPVQRVDGDEEPEECVLCAGAHFICTRRATPDMPQEIAPCPACTNETTDERTARLLRLSGLRGMMLGMTFDQLENVRGLMPAIKAVKRLVAGEIQQVVLTGPPGVGKTHVATAGLHACIEAGEPSLYLNMAEFLDQLRMSYEADTPESYGDVMRPALTWPVCLIDDLGAERRETSYAIEKPFEVVDARYRAGLRTIVCSNEPPDSWDQRVRSRLCDRNRGDMVIISGVPDYRLARRA